jgi:hypothetical protein
MIQDKAHHDKRDVDVLKHQKENISRWETSISISHTAGQNNKNQKEIGLEVSLP